MVSRLWDSVTLLNFCSADRIWGTHLRVNFRKPSSRSRMLLMVALHSIRLCEFRFFPRIASHLPLTKIALGARLIPSGKNAIPSTGAAAINFSSPSSHGFRDDAIRRHFRSLVVGKLAGFPLLAFLKVLIHPLSGCCHLRLIHSPRNCSWP
jgi:hypothetical protein